MTAANTAVFALPETRVAGSPPEARGLARDEVRLLVASDTGISHTSFRRLADHLQSGDLLVINTSPTMPAALEGTMRGRSVTVHLSTRHDDSRWTIEIRMPDNSGPIRQGMANEAILLDGGGRLQLEEPADGTIEGSTRLWRAVIEAPAGIRSLMQGYGRPIRYAYVADAWPLEVYQTVYADLSRWPGSAEMASAGRPLTSGILTELNEFGVATATVSLDAGVSSLDTHEPPQPERFAVSKRTARLVNQTRANGGRVVAVGTTATRALESAIGEDGDVVATGGWTGLILGPDRPARIVDGLVTGWHPPEASHLQLLEAVAGPLLVSKAYESALAGDYLWHEFGDSCLFLPPRSSEAPYTEGTRAHLAGVGQPTRRR